jgi:hypothetical protein
VTLEDNRKLKLARMTMDGKAGFSLLKTKIRRDYYHHHHHHHHHHHPIHMSLENY